MEYEVKMWELVCHSTTVEATNRDEAYTKAWEVIANGPDAEYETESVGFTGEWDAYPA
jgi:hypothetical protein